MASNFNIKSVHRDGKTELKIGVDETAKIISANHDEVLFSNSDGTSAIISLYNIPCIPMDAGEDNKLVTQNDLKKMMKNINDAMNNMQEAMDSMMELAQIVGLIGGENE